MTTLNRVPHVPEAEPILVSVPSLCDNNHAVKLTNKKYAVKKTTA